MSDDPKRPILVLLTSHWISMLGVALVTTAGFSWLFVLPIQLRGNTSTPYIGIVIFIFIPVIFYLRADIDRARRSYSPAAHPTHRARTVGGPRPASLHSEACDFLRPDLSS